MEYLSHISYYCFLLFFMSLCPFLSPLCDTFPICWRPIHISFFHVFLCHLPPMTLHKNCGLGVWPGKLKIKTMAPLKNKAPTTLARWMVNPLYISLFTQYWPNKLLSKGLLQQSSAILHSNPKLRTNRTPNSLSNTEEWLAGSCLRWRYKPHKSLIYHSHWRLFDMAGPHLQCNECKAVEVKSDVFSSVIWGHEKNPEATSASRMKKVESLVFWHTGVSEGKDNAALNCMITRHLGPKPNRQISF